MVNAMVNQPSPLIAERIRKGDSMECQDDITLRWRHNDHAGVPNHQSCGCLLNRLFSRRSKKTSKPRVTGLWAGNSPGTGEFPAQRASYAENVSIWWRRHDAMETLSAALSLSEGIHRWPVGSTHNGPVMRTFDVFFNKLLKEWV